MKKIFAVLISVLCLFTFIGCASLQTNTDAKTAINVTTDVAFIAALQNNPSYKADVVAGLKNLKLFLNVTGCTYDDLLAEVIKQFPQTSKYAIYAVVISYYLDCDKPVSTTLLPMLDNYKAGIEAKIDRLIQLAAMIP
jgi:hypothetical protein